MQRNKYLEDLGIPLNKIGTNFCDDNDKRSKCWKKQRKKYGFDERETWCLDHIFIEWLYSHIKMFKKIGGKCIDLDFHKFIFEEKEYTQREAMNYILKVFKKYLLSEDPEWNPSLMKEVQKCVHLWAEILPAMWW